MAMHEDERRCKCKEEVPNNSDLFEDDELDEIEPDEDWYEDEDFFEDSYKVPNPIHGFFFDGFEGCDCCKDSHRRGLVFGAVAGAIVTATTFLIVKRILK